MSQSLNKSKNKSQVWLYLTKNLDQVKKKLKKYLKQILYFDYDVMNNILT